MTANFPNYDYDLPLDYPNNTQEHDYYNLFYQVSETNDTDVVDEKFTTTCMLRSIFVFVARIGFILVEVGSIPVENVYLIVLYNVVDIAVVIVSYSLIGNRLAFGPDSKEGWVASGGWNKYFSIETDLDLTIKGFCSCLLATAQMSTFFAGRVHLVGGMLLTVFYCAVFLPFLMHWIWSETGWMKFHHFLDQEVYVKDHAGSLVIHIPSAIFGCVGSLFLGRRILKLKDVDVLSFGSGTALSTVAGYLMIVIGYMFFALPSTFYEDTHEPLNYSALIAINNLLAVGEGILIVTLLQYAAFRYTYRYRRMARIVQAGLAGIITIAAGVDVYRPSSVMILSICSTFFFFFFAELIHSTALADPCSVISSHLVCGFFGVILCPLLARTEKFGPQVKLPTVGVHLLWQFVCILVVVSLSFIVALFMFLLLKILRILRNEHEVVNHARAIILQDAMTKRSFMERLFPINVTTDLVTPGYRAKYFDSGKVIDTGKIANKANLSQSDGDKVKRKVVLENQKLRDNDNQFDSTVMSVTTQQIPTELDIDRQIRGSGDFYDPYLDMRLASDPEELSKVVPALWRTQNQV